MSQHSSYSRIKCYIAIIPRSGNTQDWLPTLSDTKCCYLISNGVQGDRVESHPNKNVLS